MKKTLLTIIAIIFFINGSISQQLWPLSSLNPNLYSCDGIMQFYPRGNAKVQVKVDFIFSKPSSGQGRWDNLSQAKCQQALDSLNHYLANIKPTTFPLPSPAPYFSTAKIELVFNSIKRPVSDSAYNYAPYYGHLISTDAISFIFGNSSTNWGYGVGRISSGALYLITQLDTFETNFIDRGYLFLMLHELGHVFGLNHTDQNRPKGFLNPSGSSLPPGVVNDFWFEDSLQFGNSCGSTYPASPNNLMGYGWGCRDYLSPKQIAMMHSNLRSHPKLKATVLNYGNSIDCNLNPSLSYTVPQNTTDTWTTEFEAPGNIVVETGAHLTISTLVKMTVGSSIIVKPGGKLTVNAGCITSGLCGQWKGIEVWGNNLPQSINSSGMPVNSGMVNLVGAIISNAEIGVRLGKSLGPNQEVVGSGGGIIISMASKYINNKIAVKFAPHSGFGGYLADNISSFRLDTFGVDQNYNGIVLPEAAVKMNSVKGIKFLGCYFEDIVHCSSIGIKASNSSIIVKNYCNSISTGLCVGSQTRNEFAGFQYCIRLSGSLLNLSSKIDGVKFDQQHKFLNAGTSGFVGPFSKSEGAIHLVHDFGSTITNCEFYSRSQASQNSIVYGIYIDNSSGYVIENNYFGTSIETLKTAGIYVNNSGPNSNSIYYNTFDGNMLGVWAENENYDQATGGGLLMQCNEFVNLDYNIGVQSLYLGTICSGCPLPTQDAGISTVQGNVGNGLPSQIPFYVRNSYATNACNANAENKYYIDTHNPFTIINHGSFSNLWAQPTPQTNNSCSNPTEVAIVTGTSTPSPNRAVYCLNNHPTIGYSLKQLNDSASNRRVKLSTLNEFMDNSLDGGNTQELLDSIYSGELSNDALKNLLLNKLFLSDTVLKAYFSVTIDNHDHVLDVVAKNAPLHPRVWSLVSGFGLSAGEKAVWDSVQFQNKSSDRVAVQSLLTMAHNDLGLVNNEKIRRFLNDSGGPLFDSIMTMLNLNEIPQSKFRKIDIAIASGNVDLANELLYSLEAESDSNLPYFNMMQHYLALHTQIGYDSIMRQNEDIFLHLKDLAASNNALVEGYAKAMLHEVYDSLYTELRLAPSISPSERKNNSNTSKEVSDKENKLIFKNGINIYPNPVADYLNVELNSETAEVILQVSDISGKTLIKEKCKGNCNVNTQNLNNGMYLLYLLNASDGKNIEVKKIIIAK